MQKEKSPGWRFEKCANEENFSDYEIKLTGKLRSRNFKTQCSGRDKTDKSANFEDYGLILRGIHPARPKRRVLILAGPHSVGTGSACLAATKPQLLKAITEKLIGKAELTDRNIPIWVLVKGVTDDSGHLDISRVSIVDAGVL